MQDLLTLAVQAERNAEQLYRGMAQLFARYPQVSQFWTQFANEENGHAYWMEKLPGRIDAARLQQPAPLEMVTHARKQVRLTPATLLADIANLQDAWELANDLEHGETNMVFEFLIACFAEDEHTLAFLRAQLSDHITHLLTGMPVQLSSADMRRATRSYRD